MTWLFPAFGLAGLGIIVPILLHLYSKRKKSGVAVGNLDWFNPVESKETKNVQLVNPIQLILRCLLLLLLVAAFACPRFPMENEPEEHSQLCLIDPCNFSASFSLSEAGLQTKLLSIHEPYLPPVELAGQKDLPCLPTESSSIQEILKQIETLHPLLDTLYTAGIVSSWGNIIDQKDLSFQIIELPSSTGTRDFSFTTIHLANGFNSTDSLLATALLRAVAVTYPAFSNSGGGMGDLELSKQGECWQTKSSNRIDQFYCGLTDQGHEELALLRAFLLSIQSQAASFHDRQLKKSALVLPAKQLPIEEARSQSYYSIEWLLLFLFALFFVLERKINFLLNYKVNR